MAMDKNEQEYKKIVKKYTEIAQELDISMSKSVAALIENLAFMEVELKKVKEQVLTDGWIEEYKNGANQFGKKESSAGKAYNNLIKSYLATWKEFKSLLSKAAQKELDDGFDSF